MDTQAMHPDPCSRAGLSRARYAGVARTRGVVKSQPGHRIRRRCEGERGTGGWSGKWRCRRSRGAAQSSVHVPYRTCRSTHLARGLHCLMISREAKTNWNRPHTLHTTDPRATAQVSVSKLVAFTAAPLVSPPSASAMRIHLDQRTRDDEPARRSVFFAEGVQPLLRRLDRPSVDGQDKVPHR